MTTLRFPLRFLDAVRVKGEEDTVYYAVGLAPEWRRKTFTVYLMTAPDGIETYAPLHDVEVLDRPTDAGRLAFLKTMRLTDQRQVALGMVEEPSDA
jgi:hypothetical protein